MRDYFHHPLVLGLFITMLCATSLAWDDPVYLREVLAATYSASRTIAAVPANTASHRAVEQPCRSASDLNQAQNRGQKSFARLLGLGLGPKTGSNSLISGGTHSFAIPTDYVTSGNASIDFPGIAVPQYAVIDLGPDEPLDMDDNADVLLFDWGNYAYHYWSAGSLTSIPETETVYGVNYAYTWNMVGSDGSVLGSYYTDDYDYGFARWTSANGTSGVSFYDIAAEYVSGNITDVTVNPDYTYFTREGCFAVMTVVTHTTIGYNVNGSTEFGDDGTTSELGYDNSYWMMLRFNSNGTVTKLGDTLFEGGEETPTGTVAISYNIDTDSEGDHLTRNFAATYSRGEDITGSYVTNWIYHIELDAYLPIYADYSYPQTDWDGSGNVTLNGHEITNPEGDDGWGSAYAAFGAPYDLFDSGYFTYALRSKSVLTNLDGEPVLLNPFFDYDSTQACYSILGGNLAEGNLTGASLAWGPIGCISNDGLIVDSDGMPVVNGVEAQYAQIFSPDAVISNTSLNLTALMPGGTITGTGNVTFQQVSATSDVLLGWAQNATATHAILAVPFRSIDSFDLTVDYNRDGNITFDGNDDTSEGNPFVFWLNDDVDRLGVIEANVADDLNPADYSGNLDWNQDHIQGTRDLEDFARLWLNIGALQSDVSSGNIFIGLKWVDYSGNIGNTTTPAIKLYPAYGSGDASYLTNSTIAANQTTGTYNNATVNVDGSENATLVQPTSNDWDFILPQAIFANLTAENSTVHFLFEGCREGTGTLTVELLYYNGTGYTEMGDGPGVSLDLKDIKEMYERWTVGEGNGSYTVPSSTASISTQRLPEDGEVGLQYANLTEGEEDTPYILFVHGWNVEPWERDAFAETMFKRLYWQGYQGRFGAFQWPTTYGDAFDSLLGGYDDGERTAWLSGNALLNLLNGPLAQYAGNNTLYVYAHSMGNVLTGEALRLVAEADSGNLVNTYVASQAAVPGEAWDANVTANATLSFPFGTGPDTPDIYGNWMISDNGTAAGAKVNFSNTKDYALGWWQDDQTLKPDWFPFYTYYYNDSNLTVVNGTFNYAPAPDLASAEVIITAHTGAFPTALNLGNAGNATTSDRYEIMSYDAEPRSLPLGQIASNLTLNGFSAVNLGSNLPNSGNVSNIWPADTLSGNQYSDHAWHSAQFRFDNMAQDPYWNELMKKFGLTPNHNSSP